MSYGKQPKALVASLQILYEQNDQTAGGGGGRKSNIHFAM
jgi:hypothetical protein